MFNLMNNYKAIVNPLTFYEKKEEKFFKYGFLFQLTTAQKKKSR